ncbi:MAG TPA: response regulator transcription factor [Anaerolineae bacterium]|nr:response regulator transcription factor [Anaerolineae bacterium]
MIRVLICDDQDIVRQGLEVILSTASSIEVVGAAEDGAQALELVSQTQPDVVLMDLKMPGMNGIVATQRICDQFPEVKVLVLTTYDADEWVFDAIRSGASGYLLKDTPREELIRAIEGTASGKTHIDPDVAGKLLAHTARTTPAPKTKIVEELSEREVEVLKLLARGLSNADIAQRLFLSEGTVRNYVSAILAKLDVADRTQAAILALRYGLVDANEET